MNKMRDINFFVNRDDIMRRELESTRNKIRVATEQIVHMRRQKVLFQIILKREMGLDIEPDEIIDIEQGWRTRSLEKDYLKSELVTLVDVLKDVDPKFHYDPEALPTNISSVRDVLLTPGQMDCMIELYHNFNVCSGTSSYLPKTIEAYLEMRRDYEAQLLQNQAMIEEIKAKKQRLEDLQLKAKEDKKFMKFLTTFKIKDKGPIENGPRQLHLEILTPEVEEPQPRSDDSAKYKEMWAANLKEMNQMRHHIVFLNGSIDLVTRRMLGIERLCLVNLSGCQKLELLPPHQDCLRRKSSLVVTDNRSNKAMFWSRKTDLQIAQNENNYLTIFISENIIPKERDFAKLHVSLQETAAKYRAILAIEWEKMRAEKLAEARHMLEEAKKAAGKGKKGKKTKK